MSDSRAGAGEGPDAGADGEARDENEQAGTSSLPNNGDDNSGGEDDASTEKEGDDSHLHEDQKSPTL